MMIEARLNYENNSQLITPENDLESDTASSLVDDLNVISEYEEYENKEEDEIERQKNELNSDWMNNIGNHKADGAKHKEANSNYIARSQMGSSVGSSSLYFSELEEDEIVTEQQINRDCDNQLFDCNKEKMSKQEADKQQEKIESTKYVKMPEIVLSENTLQSDKATIPTGVREKRIQALIVFPYSPSETVYTICETSCEFRS